MWILAGGCDRKYPEYWTKLAKVVLGELEEPASILSCMFSQDEQDRPSKYEAFDPLFAEHFGADSHIEHALADTFYEQIAQANVIYLHGGRTDKLKSAIADPARFKQAVAGKIVIGSSAGSNYLSEACYSPSKESTMKGSGIIPVGVVVHYGIESFEGTVYDMAFWRDAARQVRAELSSHAPLILLPEGQFVVLHDDDY